MSMDSRFIKLMDQVEEAFRRLRDSPVLAFPLGRARLPEKGVYLFSEKGKPLYVGRSDRLRLRLNEHQRSSAGTNAATFAALIARKACGLDRQYDCIANRPRHPDWNRRFAAAKERIRHMEVRVVEESRSTPQALLEIYVATVLKTPYNDFGNH